MSQEEERLGQKATDKDFPLLNSDAIPTPPRLSTWPGRTPRSQKSILEEYSSPPTGGNISQLDPLRESQELIVNVHPYLVVRIPTSLR